MLPIFAKESVAAQPRILYETLFQPVYQAQEIKAYNTIINGNFDAGVFSAVPGKNAIDIMLEHTERLRKQQNLL